jgi:hypothetical protein
MEISVYDHDIEKIKKEWRVPTSDGSCLIILVKHPYNKIQNKISKLYHILILLNASIMGIGIN